jgi:hypothetical protein
MDEDDHDPWLNESRSLLAAARGDTKRVVEAVRQLSLVAFRQWRFSPAIVFDYLFISTPGLFGEAGYSDAEVDSLMPQIESCVELAWAHRAAE